ncbi:MAG: Lin1244/Lin1753 domain-containing protein [Patescibacteria group bacterium]
MSRPKKATIDYFPHFVNHKHTLFTIEQKFGNDGYAFWFKLLEILGISEHHFIDCNDVEVWEFMLAKTRVNEDIAKSILNLLAKLDAIDAELWKIKVIRSNKFIENLDTVYSRRRVSVISNAEVLDLCKQKHYIKGVSVSINPQSKVKYSKVKESKVYINDMFITAQHLSMTESEYIKLVSEFGKPIVDEKIEYAKNYSKLNKYTSLYLTLNNWLKRDSEKAIAELMKNGGTGL